MERVRRYSARRAPLEGRTEWRAPRKRIAARGSSAIVKEERALASNPDARPRALGARRCCMYLSTLELKHNSPLRRRHTHLRSLHAEEHKHDDSFSALSLEDGAVLAPHRDRAVHEMVQLEHLRERSEEGADLKDHHADGAYKDAEAEVRVGIRRKVRRHKRRGGAREGEESGHEGRCQLRGYHRELDDDKEQDKLLVRVEPRA